MREGVKILPLDTQFNDDWQMFVLDAGAKGLGILIAMMQVIYWTGYYVKYDDRFLLEVRKTLALELEEIEEIVEKALKYHIFDIRMYKKHKILTSADIQSRYFIQVKRRKGIKINPLYILTADAYRHKGSIIAITDYKEEKNDEDYFGFVPPPDESLIVVIQKLHKKFTGIEPTEKDVNMVYDYILKPPVDVEYSESYRLLIESYIEMKKLDIKSTTEMLKILRKKMLKHKQTVDYLNKRTLKIKSKYDKEKERILKEKTKRDYLNWLEENKEQMPEKQYKTIKKLLSENYIEAGLLINNLRRR